MDGASVLPVLALDLQPGDSVLDMCAAPGGKSLSIMQTLMPRLLVSNDISSSRIKHLKRVMDEYVADMGEWSDKFFITKENATEIVDVDAFNKVIFSFQLEINKNVMISRRTFQVKIFSRQIRNEKY